MAPVATVVSTVHDFDLMLLPGWRIRVDEMPEHQHPCPMRREPIGCGIGPLDHASSVCTIGKVIFTDPKQRIKRSELRPTKTPSGYGPIQWNRSTWCLTGKKDDPVFMTEHTLDTCNSDRERFERHPSMSQR